jgi:hypothetical protein
MIPTMILFGLVFGRWWRSAVAVGTIGWPVLLLTEGILDDPSQIAGAAALGFANTLVGVAVHQLALRFVRNLRRGRHIAQTRA